MKLILLFLLLQTGSTDDLIRQVVESGRVAAIARNPSDRVAAEPQIAPGQPPLLRFRYLEGRQRGRHTNLDLVLDDAGH